MAGGADQAASLAGADLLIKAKVRPPVSDGWVERARPEALLTEALESRRVVVISATAGAGKTTLLDALAQRTTMGIITGDMFVNGRPLDASFQRKTGYVQQQGKVFRLGCRGAAWLIVA